MSDFQFEMDLADPDTTRRVAGALAQLLQAGDSIALQGDLGAGKTLFVQALAAGLEMPANVQVTSPTFTLLNEYHGGRLTLMHADLYRLASERELEEIGLYECFDVGAVVCVEWGDRFPVMPNDALMLALLVTGDTTRRMRVQGAGIAGVRAQQWHSVLAQTESASLRA